MAESVIIGQISFSPGFSDGFETQNRLLLSAIYSVKNSSIIEDAGISVSSSPLSSYYNLNYALIKGFANIPVSVTNHAFNLNNVNIITGVNYTFSAEALTASYNINNPEVIIAIPDWLNDAQVPWNSYWRDDTECKDNERELYSTLITDTYNKFACVWVYYPTSYNITYDRVFKEDQNKYVIRAFSAMGYIEDIPAEHKSFNLEGIIGLDIVRAYFSISHFTEASTYSGITSGIYGSYSPAVGDICYLTPNSAFYEVINVKDTIEQFMNRPNNYEVTMRVFKDNKMTVSATIPFTDPIYTVCSSAASATEQFHDYLAINPDVDILISAIEYQPKPGEKIQDTFNGW